MGMGDIRDAFGEFALAQWPGFVSFDQPPPFKWPESPVPVLLGCWRKFRDKVLDEHDELTRADLVEPAKWLKFLCSAIRRSDEDAQHYYPWMHQIGVEMCQGRMGWTVLYWWTCDNEDRAWARRLRPSVGPVDGVTIEPESKMDHSADSAGWAAGHKGKMAPSNRESSQELLAQAKQLLGIRTGLVPNGVARQKRCAWVAWPTSREDPEYHTVARHNVGTVRTFH